MDEVLSSTDDSEDELVSADKDDIESESMKSDEDTCSLVSGSKSLPNLGTSVVRRRLGRSYTSSSEEEEVTVPTKFRRRKKRKRPVGEEERKTRQKAAWIEEALREGNKDRLSQLATSNGGLLSDEIRVRVWPCLMGLNVLGTDLVLPVDEEITSHPEYNQVVLDVNRTLKRFPPGIEEAARPALQEQLTRLILRVLLTHPSLHYYQGYHDVAITFLLVVGEHHGYQIMERLSVTHLCQFMAPSMEQTMELLQLIYPIIRRCSPSLYCHLVEAELGTVFALPWLITWFGHVLPDYPDVVRLYDFFIVGPPLMPVYLAAAIVLYREQEILATECEMSEVHCLLSKIPINLPFEDLLVRCQKLYEKFPPFSVEREARSLLGSEEEGAGFGQLVPKFVIFGTPILVGVVIWKVYTSLYS